MKKKEKMNFYNLKHKEEQLNFKEATIKGQGKDKGLFFPEDISKFSPEFLKIYRIFQTRKLHIK
jgi:threonine synthase